ncbi:MAG: hypothetical protein GQ550_06365 [Gammaproteobacteria bacterium]|nr:hypothetical protein [Gammaproteobacteria bacterium]
MSDLDKRISDALDNGAEYLAMGQIAAHTGLLVSPAPLDNTDYDIIVNNIDLSKGCMIEVIHSRDQFKGNLKGTEYDFLVFVYAPSQIENGMVKPSRGKDADEARGMYVFPRDVVRSAIEDETGSYFNPENIRVSGKKDKNKYKEYRDAFHLITELVPNSPPDFKP